MSEITAEQIDLILDASEKGMRAIEGLMAENERLRAALTRLGSMEAFDVATANVPDEIKMRVDFARAALQPPFEMELDSREQ